MSRGAQQRNLSAVADAIKDLGGEVVRYFHSRRHIRVKFRTPAGAEDWLQVSNAPIDPYKLKGWTRQAMMRADRPPADNRRFRRRPQLIPTTPEKQSANDP